MKAKIERIIAEFLEYCKLRYDTETIRHYTMNMNRFYTYILQHKTRCTEYHNRYYYENKKPKNEKDDSWMKAYRRIQYVENIDRDYITRYVSFVNYDELNKNTFLPLSQSEKESRLYPLKSFLGYCLRKGYLRKDIRKFIFVPPREKKVLKRSLKPGEIKKFIESPDTTDILGIRNRALLELSYSGLRATELLTLKTKHIDNVVNSITILNGKGDKDRVVPMTSEAMYWVKRWLNIRQQIIRNRPDPEYLFITRGNKLIRRRAFSKMVKKYAEIAEINLAISPHDLRRATATHLAENGAPTRQIQALLGHSTLKVTSKYLRISDEKIKLEHKKSHPSNKRTLHYGKIHK